MDEQEEQEPLFSQRVLPLAHEAGLGTVGKRKIRRDVQVNTRNGLLWLLLICPQFCPPSCVLIIMTGESRQRLVPPTPLASEPSLSLLSPYKQLPEDRGEAAVVKTRPQLLVIAGPADAGPFLTTRSDSSYSSPVARDPSTACALLLLLETRIWLEVSCRTRNVGTSSLLFALICSTFFARSSQDADR